MTQYTINSGATFNRCFDRSKKAFALIQRYVLYLQVDRLRQSGFRVRIFIILTYSEISSSIMIFLNNDKNMDKKIWLKKFEIKICSIFFFFFTRNDLDIDI